MYEFGSRAGFWRLHRILVSHAIPVTVYAVGQALERNPSAGKAMAAAGWEVAGHGWRWIDYKETPRDEERRHIQQTISTIERICGQSPLGWYTGRRSENTRRLIVEQGTFLYDSDSYADDLPYWEEVEGAKHLVVPYALDTNDYKFLISNGFVTSRDFLEYLTDAFDVAYAEGGRMMTLAVHCRIAGRPGRAKAVTTFLDYVKEHEHVWFATRADIARHWYSRHPPD
jgi:peptidoglycan/xylan/chitin deacetylase (PgdA/CDA1 family)